MADGAEDAVLVGNVVHLLRFDQLVLFHYFDAEILVRVLFLHQPHLPEGTYVMTGVPSPRTARYSKSFILTYTFPFFSTFFYIIYSNKDRRAALHLIWQISVVCKHRRQLVWSVLTTLEKCGYYLLMVSMASKRVLCWLEQSYGSD